MGGGISHEGDGRLKGFLDPYKVCLPHWLVGCATMGVEPKQTAASCVSNYVQACWGIIHTIESSILVGCAWSHDGTGNLAKVDLYLSSLSGFSVAALSRLVVGHILSLLEVAQCPHLPAVPPQTRGAPFSRIPIRRG